MPKAQTEAANRLPLKPLLQALRNTSAEMIATLRRFVEAESPSLEKDPADACCSIVVAEWQRLGLETERIAQMQRGDHLRITWQPETAVGSSQLLVLGHYDTVYATGTLPKMPFRIADGNAYGPGTFDMKAGIVQALFAVRALREMRVAIKKRCVFLWTSDEEIGSESSRKLIEDEARRSDAVFVLEPSFGPRGLLKTSRKGVGEAEIIVHGTASHAGLAPEKGVNAVHELAAQIARIEKWNDLRRGITLNADVIEGGTRANVIAEKARAVVDLRALRIADMRNVEQRLRALRPIHRGARLEIHGGFNRAPLERKMSAALYANAQHVARELGLKIGETMAGGGSDGNLTAALGIPTLDGLGAVGDGAHSSNEHVIIAKMPERAALLAGLLAAC
jgi:glutamate carboxypeptidase